MKIKSNIPQFSLLIITAALLLSHPASATERAVTVNSVTGLRSQIQTAVQEGREIAITLSNDLSPNDFVPQVNDRDPLFNAFPTIRGIVVSIDCQGHRLVADREPEQTFRAFDIVQNGSLNLKDCHLENFSATATRAVSNNTKDFEGGAIYVREGGRLNLENVTLRKNYAYRGGAIYLKGGRAKVNNSSFIENTALLRPIPNGTTVVAAGGAISSSQRANLDITNSTFLKNASGAHKTSGGAIFFSGSNLNITNTTFGENGNFSSGVSDVSQGGAIHLVSGTLRCVHCSFVKNLAQEGGALYIRSAGEPNASIFNSIFDGNLSNAPQDQENPRSSRRSDVCFGKLHVGGVTAMFNLASPFHADCQVEQILLEAYNRDTWIINQAGPMVGTLVAGTGLEESFYPVIRAGVANNAIPAEHCLESDQRAYGRVARGVENCDAGAIELENSEESAVNRLVVENRPNPANDFLIQQPNRPQRPWEHLSLNPQDLEIIDGAGDRLIAGNSPENNEDTPDSENQEVGSLEQNPFAEVGDPAENAPEGNQASSGNSGCSLQTSKTQNKFMAIAIWLIFALPVILSRRVKRPTA